MKLSYSQKIIFLIKEFVFYKLYYYNKNLNSNLFRIKFLLNIF